MLEIKAALDAAFAAYSDALSSGAPQEVALAVGIARYRAFFPDAVTAVFEVAIQAAREKARADAAAAGAPPLPAEKANSSRTNPQHQH